MKATKIAVLAVLVTGLLVGSASAGQGELEKLALKAYWSVLDEGQKEEAKELFARHLSETAADRLAAGSRLMQFRADVAALLSPEQRRGAWRIRKTMKGLRGERKATVWNRLLDGTDRGLLADRVERIGSSGPAEKVELGMQVLDQVFGVMLQAYAEKIDLTPDQQAQILDLLEGLKTDLRPVALRLAEAKAEVTRAALSILDQDQRAKLDQFKETVTAKVLGFLRG